MYPLKRKLAFETASSTGVAMPLEYTCVTGSIQRLNSDRSSSLLPMPKCSGYTCSNIAFRAKWRGGRKRTERERWNERRPVMQAGKQTAYPTCRAGGNVPCYPSMLLLIGVSAVWWGMDTCNSFVHCFSFFLPQRRAVLHLLSQRTPFSSIGIRVPSSLEQLPQENGWRKRTHGVMRSIKRAFSGKSSGPNRDRRSAERIGSDLPAE